MPVPALWYTRSAMKTPRARRPQDASPPGYRVCRKCGKAQSLQACKAATAKAYNLRNATQNAERKRVWDEANRERLSVENRRRKKANKDRLSTQHRAWIAANREHVRLYEKAYRERNREKIRAKNAEWEQRNADRMLQHRREYEKNNRKRLRERSRDRIRELLKLRRHVRRAQQSQVRCDLTLEQWREIVLLWKRRCAYCKRRPKILEQDHVVAISKGGGHTASNIVPACRSCNARKGNRPLAVPLQLHLIT